MNFPGRIIKIGETDLEDRHRHRHRSGRARLPFDLAARRLRRAVQVARQALPEPECRRGRGGRSRSTAKSGRRPGEPCSVPRPRPSPPAALPSRHWAWRLPSSARWKVPLAPNRGPEVNRYLDPRAPRRAISGAWRCLLLLQGTAAASGVANPFPLDGGGAGRLDKVNRLGNPGPASKLAAAGRRSSLVRPGQVFILDHGHGLGHTGFVRQSFRQALRTVEGNSQPDRQQKRARRVRAEPAGRRWTRH